MASKHLKTRINWQTKSGRKAFRAEDKFYVIMKHLFEGTSFTIDCKPKDFRNIYSKIKLPASIAGDIYQPKKQWRHGIAPDYAIRNTKTGKSLFVEVKRQDGWVKGRDCTVGRGNAHERSCKYFTQGLLSIMRKKGKLGNNILPFWTIYQGNIARDPKRVREIYCWFRGHKNHFFLWKKPKDSESLINHFNKRLKKLLTKKEK